MLSDTITIIMPNTYISAPSAAHPTSLSWTHESCDTPDQNGKKKNERGLVIPHLTLSGVMERGLEKAVSFNTFLLIFCVVVFFFVNIYYVCIYIYNIQQTQLSRVTYRSIRMIRVQ